MMINRTCEPSASFNSTMKEAAWTQTSRLLEESLRRHLKVTLHLAGAGPEQEIRGFVTVINTYLEEIKFRAEDEWLWIKFSEITSAHT
ncbi:YolD-like family protein [Paenibacillus cineris]|uniref:YolD-like family protein n=2 Tax=Paenibacillus TaxID=44249 RepID=UPI000E23AB13|nr:YolD-like family protein [Paenibacillus cineris]